ncbi:MAG: hypothetical protein AB7H97_01820 [Pseudobdellovibrionaceae bacterium]
MKSIIYLKSVVCLMSLFLINCSGRMLAKKSQEAANAEITLQNARSTYLGIANLAEETPIDLDSYFSGDLVPAGRARYTQFETLGYSQGKRIVLLTKFNQIGNYEVYVVTDDAILIRYETAPEIYGGTKSALRRFRDSTPPSNYAAMGTTLRSFEDDGALWMKRVVRKSEQRQLFVSGEAIDHIDLTNPNQLGNLSVNNAQMLTWFEFVNTTQSIPFVDKSEPLLRISMQWHQCITEQYEYAQGVGLVAWRALYSSAGHCAGVGNIDPNSESVVFRNYYTGVDERYHVVHGDNFDSGYNTTLFDTRVKQDFKPGGIFLDDHLYQNTGRNVGLLDFLRTSGPVDSIATESSAASTTSSSGANTGIAGSTTPSSIATTAPPAVVAPEAVTVEIVAVPPPTPVPAATIEQVVRSQIANYYSLWLGRTAELSEIDYWANHVTSGRITSAQAEQLIRTSPEGTIRSYYLKFLLKAPDADGLGYWLNLHAGGRSLPQIEIDIRSNSACLNQCL